MLQEPVAETRATTNAVGLQYSAKPPMHLIVTGPSHVLNRSAGEVVGVDGCWVSIKATLTLIGILKAKSSFRVSAIIPSVHRDCKASEQM